MEEHQMLEGMALSMQVGTAVYSLRLNRLFGTARAGWALFAVFALMLVMHLNEDWQVETGLLIHGLQPQFVYLVISLLLLIGLGHVESLFKERQQSEQLARGCLGQVEEVQERTRDLSGQLAMADRLRQAEKLECVARLAGGVAHEFNNLLTVIQGHSGLLLCFPDSSAQVAESAAEIQAAGDRAAQLTRQLLAFAHLQPIEPRDLDLNELVHDHRLMLRRVLGEGIQLNFHASSTPAMVWADPVMLEHVLMNLASNARQAMPRGGELTIQIASAHLRDGPRGDGVPFKPGPYVRCTVGDTGCGIEPEHLPHIFEPFFTTRETGQGTGLGLAMAYGIVRQHGGWIQATSTFGRGTAFDIYLPARPESDIATFPSSRSIASAVEPIRTETILVVEDEASVRQLVNTVLLKQGYRVFQADSAGSALELWRTHGAEIDLLLTDIVMPGGMNGWELGQKLRSDKPCLKVVYTSGYNPEMSNPRLKQEYFVPKPYELTKLVGAIRLALDTQPRLSDRA